MPLTLAVLSVIVFRSAPSLQTTDPWLTLLKPLVPKQKNSPITFLGMVIGCLKKPFKKKSEQKYSLVPLGIVLFFFDRSVCSSGTWVYYFNYTWNTYWVPAVFRVLFKIHRWCHDFWMQSFKRHTFFLQLIDMYAPNNNAG